MKIIIATLLLFVALPISAQVKFQTLEPIDMLAKAKEEGKLAFVDVYATWCPPCKKMESEVFVREDIGKLMDSMFVAVKYNSDEETGGAILQQFQLRYIPSYLIFTAEGDLITTRSGFIEPDDFIEFLKEAKEAANQTATDQTAAAAE